MTNGCRYVMLVTSLPAHGPIFSARQTPLSRIRLDERLGMLEPEDAIQLRLVESALRWERITPTDSDESLYMQSMATLRSVENPFLRETIRDRLELRTLMAALRRRRLGDPPPDARERWGFGRWTDLIRRNWTDPVFRLQRVFPWATEANRLLSADNWIELEELLLGQVWEDLGRRGEGHYFDFEAVAIYVLRWSLVARWTGFDAEGASIRFNGLVEQAMDERIDRALDDRLALLN